MFKKKPKSVKYDLADFRPNELEWFCKTSVVDREVMRKLNLTFDEQVANDLEKHVCFYLVIDKGMQYDVISGVDFEAWLKKYNLENTSYVKTIKAEKCFKHFVDDLVGQHKAAEIKNAHLQAFNKKMNKNVN